MRPALSFGTAAAAAILLACGSAPKINDCGPGLTFCGGGCANLDTDPSNCGACGASCGAGELCVTRSCLAASQVYEDTFVQNTTDANQCDQFNSFRAGLFGDFRQIRFFGSRDPVGVACTDPVAATQLANHLFGATDTTAPILCDGNYWQVCTRGDPSGNGIEFWVGTSIQCDGGNCPAAGYLLRTCSFMSLGFWGGINTGSNLCNPPTQFISLQFDR
jgi:hypothetical protein